MFCANGVGRAYSADNLHQSIQKFRDSYLSLSALRGLPAFYDVYDA